MSAFPSEVVGLIIELSLPSPSYQSFYERSANLRTFALVSRIWRYEAQSLLNRDPVIWLDSHGTSRARKAWNFLKQGDSGEMQSLPQHLRVGGRDLHVGLLPGGIGPRLAANLTALSLYAMKFESEIFLNLSTLRVLVMQKITFPYEVNESTLSDYSLPNLTNMSTNNVQGDLPPFLLPQALPALRRLARYRPTASTVHQHSFQQLTGLQDQLDFVYCCVESFRYHEEDISLLAPKILLGIDGLVLSHPQYLQGYLVKHIKVTEGTLGNGPQSVYMYSWNVATLEKFLDTTLPNVETLVVPHSWPKSPFYSNFLQMMKKRNIVLLVEDSQVGDFGETYISIAFKEHLRRKALGGGK